MKQGNGGMRERQQEKVMDFQTQAFRTIEHKYAKYFGFWIASVLLGLAPRKKSFNSKYDLS